MRSSSKTLFTIVTAYLATTVSTLTCTREGLLAAANTYLAAQASGNPKLLKLASSNFTYMQNNKASEISTGLLSTPFTIDLNRSTADTTACASYTMWISASASKPYVVGTQIRHAANDTSVISSIDTVASTTGDLFFNATKTLSYIRTQNWGLLPTSSQPSRASLKAIGDAYLDMWTNATALNAIPWGTDCVRVEGSSYVEHCGANLPRGGSKTENGLRRYVIDEGTGSVQVNCQFDSLGPWPDSHEIRVEAGKVKYVHTVTVLRGVGA